MSAAEIVLNNVDLYAQLLVNKDKSKSKTQHVIKAHITALVSALGGLDNTSSQSPPPYKLGINALAVLKDLKKWLRFDQSNKKLDVNLAIGESNLVTFDILHILSNWEHSYLDGLIFKDANTKLYHDRIASMCLELLVPLTWPLLLIDQESTMNQVINYHKLKQYQVEYKKAMMNFSDGIIFRAIIRLVVPVVSLPKHKRNIRDNSILNLVFLFFRNILSIEPAENTVFEIKGKSRSNKSVIKTSESVSAEDISLDLLIKIFAKNKVLKFLLLVLSNLGKEFDDEILGFSALECLYYLTNNITIRSLFTDHSSSKENNYVALDHIDSSRTTRNPSSELPTQNLNSPLANLLAKEKKLKTKFIKDTASRHSGFGSLLLFNSAETGRLTVSGQRALMSTENTMEALNKAKKWNTQKQRIAVQSEEFNDLNNNNLDDEYDRMNYLTDESKISLKEFSNSFLDAGFNQFIKIMSKKLYSNIEELVEIHCIQYCLVSAWFLEFEKFRRFQNEEYEKRKRQEEKQKKSSDLGSILVGEFNDIQNKSESILSAEGVDNSKESLTVVGDTAIQEEEEKDLTDFGLIGAVLLNENIAMMKLFLSKEQDNSDVSFCHAIIVLFKEIFSLLMDMGKSEFQNDIEVSATVFKKIFTDNAFLMALVRISRNAHNKNLKYILSVIDLLDIVFRMLEKLRKDDRLVIVSKRNQNKENQEKSSLVFKEFNFNDFFVRFISEKTINSFFRVLREYENIDPSYIKKVIKFFHKIIFVYKFQTILLRLDLVLILHEILKDPGFLHSDLLIELQGFFKHYMKVLRHQLEENPLLCVEILFPKLTDSVFFAQEKSNLYPVADNSGIKVVKPIEFKPSQDANLRFEEKIGLLVVALMKNERTSYLIRFLMNQISDIIKNWENENQKHLLLDAETLDIHENEKLKKDVLRNANFRLLLHLCGFILPEAYGEKCELKEKIQQSQLLTISEILKKYFSLDYVFNADEEISSFIRKIPIKQIDDNHSDSSDNENEGYNTDGTSSDSDEEEAGERVDNLERLEGIIDKSVSNKKEKKRKSNKKKSKKNHKHKKTQNVSTIQRKFASALYIDSEDDLSDEEADQLFFEKERRLRELINANNGIISREQYKKLNFQFQGEGINVNGDDLVLSDKDGSGSDIDNRKVNDGISKPNSKLFVEENDDYDSDSGLDKEKEALKLLDMNNELNNAESLKSQILISGIKRNEHHDEDQSINSNYLNKRRKIVVPDSDDD